MKAFMTNGTYEFLTKLTNKYATVDFFFMTGNSSTLAYYEGYDKDVFAAGREYLVLQQNGKIEKEGYVVMNNISVLEEGVTMFEERFRQRQSNLDKMPGFQAFRLLKPKRGNTYVVMTQWESERYFNNWKDSDAFKQQHEEGPAKPPAFFADKPFVTHYTMIKPEEE